METIDWVIMISVIIFICLGVWGVRFPRSSTDWKKDRAESVSMVFSLTLFLAFFLLLWYVMGVIDWPPALDMVIWSSAIIFAILILAAIFLPTGTKLNLGKKDKKVQTADDDDD